MTQYVIIQESSSGSIFCIGIFGDIYTAIGKVMEDIWEFHDSYREPGDKFEVTEPYDLEGDGGIGIEVTYKAACWNEEFKDHYFILNYEMNINGGKC